MNFLNYNKLMLVYHYFETNLHIFPIFYAPYDIKNSHTNYVKKNLSYQYYELATWLKGPSKYSAKALAFSFSIPKPTFCLEQYKHNSKLDTVVIATFPS